MSEDIIVSLPSLIHRIGREEVKQAKAIARQYHCELKRVRRSRNWSLSGGAISIQSYSAGLKTQGLKMENAGGFGYLMQKIDTGLLDHTDKLEPLEAKLARLLTDNPNITLAELIHITDCTTAEARQARFYADSW
ncbi:ribosome recycling factor family protein [Shewanella sp.]|uniref:ribosome recycling factor family protein n=1 Tax=Shewanella sp. TaxID=50422 RepID=UPI001EC8610D|nr:ribosome recycling factor family protein [Shewanella sp.]NRB22785.1 RRF family protein [Shewanella sp.]